MRFMEVEIERIKDHAEYRLDRGFLKNIKREGVRVPVILSGDDESGYVVIDGRRRVCASREAGLEKIPAVVVNGDANSLLGLMLNFHRSPNPSHEVEVIKELVREGYTIDEMAKALDTTRTKLKRYFHLLNLCDEGFERLRDGRLKMGTAVALSKLPVETQRRILSNNEVITLKTVESERRNFNLESFGSIFDEAVFSEVHSLGAEFENIVARLTTGRVIPDEVKSAIEVLRKFIEKEVETL